MDDFLELEPGTVIEAGALLPGVTKERLTHQVILVDRAERSIEVESRWLGVLLGQLVGREDDKGGVAWTCRQDAAGKEDA